MRRYLGTLWLAGSIVTTLFAASGCGIGVKRTFSVPLQTVIFDDMCGLQEYFDSIAAHKVDPPPIVTSTEFQREDKDRPAGGKSVFQFTGESTLRVLRRLLEENWKNVPEQVMQAEDINLEVRWADKAGEKRVVTDEEAEISVNREIFALPYQPCLSDLLFGESLYRTRRMLLGLPDIGGGGAEEAAAAAVAETPPPSAPPAAAIPSAAVPAGSATSQPPVKP